MVHSFEYGTAFERVTRVHNDQTVFGQHQSIWSVNRNEEGSRDDAMCKDVDNRMLLWHGTSISAVAPILTDGLRIMPHSGSRVGSGIYMASMSQKSADYTPAGANKYACMFLCEAALGKVRAITRDDYRLKKPPDAFDSVLAIGRLSPDTTASIDLDDRSVSVPQSEGVLKNFDTKFQHDEYLVYDEAQLRLRDVVTVEL